METVKNVVIVSLAFPTIVIFEGTHKLRKEYGEDNCVHGLWTYPLNGIVTLLAVAVQPILSIIAIVVAPIIKLIGCCSKDFDRLAEEMFGTAIATFALAPLVIVQIFNNKDEEWNSEFEPKNLPENMAPSYFAAAPAALAIKTANLCVEYADNVGHAFWTCPLNFVVSVLTIAMQPILSLISIVAAAVFRQLGCCSDTFKELADNTFNAAIAGLTAIPSIFVKIFYPRFDIK